jgi:hypothetical protein
MVGLFILADKGFIDFSVFTIVIFVRARMHQRLLGAAHTVEAAHACLIAVFGSTSTFSF